MSNASLKEQLQALSLVSTEGSTDQRNSGQVHNHNNKEKKPKKRHQPEKNAGVKQSEGKIQASLKKAQAARMTTEKQHAATSAKHQTKPSNSTKKQLATQKRNLDNHVKNVTATTSQYNQAQSHSAYLSVQLAKFSALTKQLGQFDKEWEQKSRDAMAKVAAAAAQAAAKAKAAAEAIAKKASMSRKKTTAKKSSKPSTQTTKSTQPREEILTPANNLEQTSTFSTTEVDVEPVE